MREFWVRLVSMLAIVGVLLGYNSVLEKLPLPTVPKLPTDIKAALLPNE